MNENHIWRKPTTGGKLENLDKTKGPASKNKEPGRNRKTRRRTWMKKRWLEETLEDIRGWRNPKNVEELYTYLFVLYLIPYHCTNTLSCF